jgi:hypothetical protein
MVKEESVPEGAVPRETTCLILNFTSSKSSKDDITAFTLITGARTAMCCSMVFVIEVLTIAVSALAKFHNPH